MINLVQAGGQIRFTLKRMNNEKDYTSSFLRDSVICRLR